MTGSVAFSQQGDGLEVLHQRLESHFQALCARREALAAGTPVFALEHGLSDAELRLLRAEVCRAARRGCLPRDAWLPFVIYAAEVGYRYCGDEYWQTFEAQTPGWVQIGDRQYIRRRFRQFSDRFHGAEPTGPWADHFSIICWPITHAVLPTDLQRHLARLLYEYRWSLTADLLGKPDELGRRLAARAWHASSRFQNFAQNTSLLGQVAAALLGGEDEESPYLLDSTLKRIVADLTVEREARHWLDDAKFTATRVRTRGFRVASHAPTGAARGAGGRRLPALTDPELFVQQGASGWSIHVELPDFSQLAERLPNVNSELGRLRARVEGVAGPPLARGRLLYAGQRLRLSEWPRRGRSLIQLENGSSGVNALLVDQCVLSPGPLWLFRLRERGFGREVRGKFVRPGHVYIVASELALSSLPQWAAPTSATTAGVHLYTLDVPSLVTPDDLAALERIGLGVVTDVEVRPAGVVAASWDGEGSAEWLAGEVPMIAIRSTRSVGQCIITIDENPFLVPWPTGSEELFLGLQGLGLGAYEVRVSLLPSEPDLPVADGVLAIAIRSPHTRPPAGTVREGLMIMANPVNPTLDELWDGQATLQILGPKGMDARIEISLADRSGRPLINRRISVALPVDAARWVGLFSAQFRRVEAVHCRYEEAESCVVAVSAPGLGRVELTCEREFSPLRWAFGRDRDGPFVRLVDNTDGNPVQVQRFEFTHPMTPTRVPAVPDAPVRSPRGGLLAAEASAARAAVILPPLVRDLSDLRAAPPQLPPSVRSAAEALQLIRLAYMWASASLPADPFGATRRLAVLRAITAHLAGLIGGQRWAHVEQQFATTAVSLPAADLATPVGEQPYQRRLASHLLGRLSEFCAAEPSKRVLIFAAALAVHARPAGVCGENTSLAEFLLRLASEPSSLQTWPPPTREEHLKLTLVSPVLVRAARFVVLATAIEGQEGDTISPGWTWA